jgi:hypothetical protein
MDFALDAFRWLLNHLRDGPEARQAVGLVVRHWVEDERFRARVGLVE